MNRSSLLAMLLLIGPVVSQADDRLINELLDDHARGTDLWIYNDLSAARAVARKENKPIFVTFRCVPCRDCKGFDAEVAQGSDIIAKLAREHFVPIRQVEMKGVDLNQFQFDYDLNWAAMFINADGTVYARYGTQSVEGADAYNSIEGLKSTMLRVLELHKQYPKNKASLQSKKGKPRPYATALEMPGMEKKATLAGLTSRRNCIHCHMLHDAENKHLQATGAFQKETWFRYPLPQNIGLNIVRDHGTKIESFLPNSPAEKSGLAEREEIVSLDGQAITSIADMQWVLHNHPNSDLVLSVTGSETGVHQLALKSGWKETDPSWRGSMYSVSPRFPIWTPPVADDVRQQLQLSDDQGAYLVKYIANDRETGRNAKAAGLRLNDIVIAANGMQLPLRNTRWQYEMKLLHQTGDELTLTVLRNGKEIPIRFRLAD